MITLRDLRTISLEFRRVSSNFLNCDSETADVALSRFYTYIRKTDWIWTFVSNIISSTDYNFRECFPERSDGWCEASIPVDEIQHFKAQFDYLDFLANKTPINVLGEAMHYYHSSRKFTDIIREFISDTFKPMIDYINDAISKELILIEEEAKVTAPTVYQRIENNYGTANVQGTGTQTSVTLSNGTVSDIDALIAKITSSLVYLEGIPQEDIASVRDDFESVQEQISTDSPKKPRLQKAVAGIKKFFSDFSMKVAVSLAAQSITTTDWAILIQKIEDYIAMLS